MAPHPMSVEQDISNDILVVLSNAAKLTPVRHLQVAATQALEMAGTIDNFKNNQEFKTLVHEACALVYMIVCADFKKANSVPDRSDYLVIMKEFSENLQDIHAFVKAHASKNKMQRMIATKPSTKIKTHLDYLRRWPGVFRLISNATILELSGRYQERYSDIQDLLKAILEREQQEASDNRRDRDRIQRSAQGDYTGDHEGSSRRFPDESDEQGRFVHREEVRRTQDQRREYDHRHRGYHPSREQQPSHPPLDSNQSHSSRFNNPSFNRSPSHFEAPPGQNRGCRPAAPYPSGASYASPGSPYSPGPFFSPPFSTMNPSGTFEEYAHRTPFQGGNWITHMNSPITMNSNNTETTTIKDSYNNQNTTGRDQFQRRKE